MRKKYNVKYLSSFYNELNDNIKYISTELENISAAERLLNKVESSIKNRQKSPESFKKYMSSKKRKYDWYKIYVGSYVILYIVENNTMIVAHIYYSKRDIDNLL